MSEFYVGYLPQAPPGLARSVRRIVLGLVAASVLTALVLVFWQARFPASVFEFQQYRDFEGTLREHPYPNLAVAPAMPGYLLVAPGKHGATELVAGFDGRAVRLKGSLIYRDGGRMIELVPNSLQASGNSPIPAPDAIDLGMTTLSGEIVDSKCYLGVMNPGNGKVHRDCAVRCISGGIPPAFEGCGRCLQNAAAQRFRWLADRSRCARFRGGAGGSERPAVEIGRHADSRSRPRLDSPRQ